MPLGGAKADKPLTKPQLLKALAESTGFSQTDVGKTLDAFEALVRAELRRAGSITLPGLLKIAKKDVPAKPARDGRNPATGETIRIKAKPASKTVRVRALKGLKDMV